MRAMVKIKPKSNKIKDKNNIRENIKWNTHKHFKSGEGYEGVKNEGPAQSLDCVLVRTIYAHLAVRLRTSTEFKAEASCVLSGSEQEAILFVYAVWMESDFNSLPDDMVHVSGFSEEDAGVL